MGLPEGSIDDKIGPIIWRMGMDASTQVPAMGPESVENAFNLDYDRAGRAIPRAGSVWQSRLGWGPIMGMHEHNFEVGARPPKPVAIVQWAFPTVHALNDPTMPDDGQGEEEPTPTHAFGFCPDWRTHGQTILSFQAREKDRFTFASFLNRVYIAGSTTTRQVWEYDYEQPFFRPILGVRGTVVAALGNRIYVAGDPNSPGVIYPSDPNEPDSFQPQLGIQVGTRNDEVQAMIPHDGLLFVLTKRGAHWLLLGAIELGDFQQDAVSETHGVVGRSAVARGSDGYVYWISESEGPMRWRRGLESPDSDFAQEARSFFRTAMKGDLSPSLVIDDPDSGAIRFLIPTGGCPTPNYQINYFYRAPSGRAWTHAASTTDPKLAGKVRDWADRQHVHMGEPLYTAGVSQRDSLLGGYSVVAGRSNGSIYYWRRYVKDFLRNHDGCERDFVCMLRPGPLELAPIGHRAMIHRAMIDVSAGHRWGFVLRVERDYDDDFAVIESPSYKIPGGVADELILDHEDEGRPLDRIYHPSHVRLPLWEGALAKVTRLDFRFNPEWPVALEGIELERSIAADNREDYMSPPEPFPPQEEHCPDLTCPPLGDDPPLPAPDEPEE